MQAKAAMAFVMASDDRSWSNWQTDSSCEEDQAWCWACHAVTFWNLSALVSLVIWKESQFIILPSFRLKDCRLKVLAWFGHGFGMLNGGVSVSEFSFLVVRQATAGFL